MRRFKSIVGAAAALLGAAACACAWGQALQGGQGAPASQQQGGFANRPQPAIIVDADALIRAGQRANAAEEAAARPLPPPKPLTPAQQAAAKKKGVHLSTGQPLPLSSDSAGQR